MRLLLPLLMIWILFEARLTMDAASAACRLFVTSVLPGLFPYMVLSLMLVSRFAGRMPEWLLLLLGWGGGSPTGARLLRLTPDAGRRQRVRLAVSCATMSPMFLLGTIGGWLNSPHAGMVVLASVLLGGGLAGWLAGMCTRDGRAAASAASLQPAAPLSFGSAVDQAARTMLTVCGTMVIFRVLAALVTKNFPIVSLPFVTLLEVTTGAQAIALLPLPLALRTAVLAGATGFGGAAILMQNRAMYDKSFLSLWEQILWQAVHGGISFLLALGMMQLGT